MNNFPPGKQGEKEINSAALDHSSVPRKVNVLHVCSTCNILDWSAIAL